MTTYEEIADELTRRIFNLAHEHPEVRTMQSAWDLFRVPGFNCDDLAPSLHQAQWALARARAQLLALDPEAPQ